MRKTDNFIICEAVLRKQHKCTDMYWNHWRIDLLKEYFHISYWWTTTKSPLWGYLFTRLLRYFSSKQTKRLDLRHKTRVTDSKSREKQQEAVSEAKRAQCKLCAVNSIQTQPVRSGARASVEKSEVYFHAANRSSVSVFADTKGKKGQYFNYFSCYFAYHICTTFTKARSFFSWGISRVIGSQIWAKITGHGSVMSKKSFSGGGPPRYQLQLVSERRIQAYCRACSPFRLLSSSQSVHKHSFSPVGPHGTV